MTIEEFVRRLRGSCTCNQTPCPSGTDAECQISECIGDILEDYFLGDEEYTTLDLPFTFGRIEK